MKDVKNAIEVMLAVSDNKEYGRLKIERPDRLFTVVSHELLRTAAALWGIKEHMVALVCDETNDSFDWHEYIFGLSSIMQDQAAILERIGAGLMEL